MWDYETAFIRNKGLISPEEQQKLKNSRVAIAGMGGVGGIHTAVLARIGIGKFTIADPDVFETANFNRQYGAMVKNLQRSKAEVMGEIIKEINPDAEVTVLKERVTGENVAQFMEGANLFVDGFDAYVIDPRRHAFREARKRGIYGITAGPFGFGTAWMIFDPKGLSFDDYFDFHDQMDDLDKVSAFMVGMVPAALHLVYQDTRSFNMKTRSGPSSGAGCALAAGVVGVQAIKILLNRDGIQAAPTFSQFDAHREMLVHKKINGGNKSLKQRIRRNLFAEFMRQAVNPTPPKDFKDRFKRWLIAQLLKDRK